jgi:2-oxoglutarate ferredoxin oxidoreductase subunit alpha
MSEQYKIMTGNEACVRGALAAGMSFFAGYPITPATEIAELSSELLPQHGGKFMQMEDELGSIAVVIGASTAGTKAMTATSGPGFTLMQENLSYGMMAEVPCVVVDVMRQGPCQGVATVPAQGDFMEARWGTHGDHPIITLAPSSVAETYYQTVRAFNLAEKYRTPVIMLSDATLAHMSEKVRIPDPSELTIINRKKPTCPPEEYQPFDNSTNEIHPMASFGDGYRWFASGLVHDDTGFPITSDHKAINAAIKHLVGKINDHVADIEAYEEYRMEDADIVILSVGLVSRSVKSAIDKARSMGIKAGLFRPITLWPFPGKRFEEVCAHAKAVMTCEMNEGQLAEVAAQYVNLDQRIIPITQNDGTIIRAEKIFDAIKEVG